MDVGKLIAAFTEERPDPGLAEERVAFGTSGHRGSALRRSFNERHIVAIAAAIAEHRRGRGITGPLFMGMDTHALSAPAHRVALEVLAAAGVDLRVAQGGGATPTPVVSHAIVSHNRARASGLADGIVITPSHNPPEDGGIKYNEPHGGPAGTETTRWIEERANALLGAMVARKPEAEARRAGAVTEHDFLSAYVGDLPAAVDLEAIRRAGVSIGVDPMGGASLDFWRAIGERHGLRLEIVNPTIDPTFSFMPPDHDGKIRMDCSSAAAMANLLRVRDRYDLAFGNDPDADRHGIVTPRGGLMNPNHYLAVAVSYLVGARPGWPSAAGVGKTVVSSSLIDRVAASLGRKLVEVPVGFKWFVDGLSTGALVFGGEESAGASFLRMDGQTWTTDKDGLLLCLLAAEIVAKTGKDPAEHYEALTRIHGAPRYARIDVAATRAEKQALQKLAPENVKATLLAGEPILRHETCASGNGAAIGGLKVVAANGWFAARPSGTEDVYKIYAESFVGAEHLERILAEARAIVTDALR